MVEWDECQKLVLNMCRDTSICGGNEFVKYKCVYKYSIDKVEWV